MIVCGKVRMGCGKEGQGEEAGNGKGRQERVRGGRERYSFGAALRNRSIKKMGPPNELLDLKDKHPSKSRWQS